MPELLLSSLPGKDLSAGNAKGKPSDSLNIESTGGDGVSKFTNTLTSVVNESKLEQKSANEKVDAQDGLENLSSTLEDLSEQISNIDSDIEALTDLKLFLNGQNFSTEGLSEENLGISLPDFLNQLQEKIDALNSAIEGQKELSADKLIGLEFALSQVNQSINALAATTKSDANKSELAPTLLGFSFNSGNGRGDGSNWQKYEPQQISQNGQFVGANSLDSGLAPDQLVPKTDRAFQLQMEQLVADKVVDVNDKAGMFAGSALDSKDKALSQFSDLQLKAAGDPLKQYSTTLSTPVNAQSWSDEVSQKIVWFSGRNISAAEMHLNPAELGPIDVKINVQNDIATVTFNVNNSSVKDLLESSVVRLREMMEANGVSLGEVTIVSKVRVTIARNLLALGVVQVS